MPKLQLFGGELDGAEWDISANDCPHVYFGLTSADREKVEKARPNAAKFELRDKLASLAYVLDQQASTPECFVMRRAPALDRVQQP